MNSIDAHLQQAETLQIAQSRILELEKEVEQLRQEKDSWLQQVKSPRVRPMSFLKNIVNLKPSGVKLSEQAQLELNVFRQNLQDRDQSLAKMKLKTEELENRIAKDLRKVRVRERELENRLELAKIEKSAVLRSKDETLLELKSRIDSLNRELESYKNKFGELTKKTENQSDQLNRTIRALRLALTHLEAHDNATVTPLKKAE